MKQDIEYLELLMASFMRATDTFDAPVNSSAFFKEFRDWLLKRQVILNDYIALLEKMNLDFKSSKCTESGKGFYDTIVRDNYSTKTVSPYANNVTARIDFSVIDGKPFYIHSYGENNEKCICYLPPKHTHTFIIQNPYFQEQLNGFEQLHNSGLYDIIVGVYGGLTDKDQTLKIDQIIDIINY